MSSETNQTEGSVAISAKFIESLFDERCRQHNMWGVRDHPDVNELVPRDRYGIGSAEELRQACQDRFRLDKGSWTDILLEEVAEAVEEAVAGNSANLRAELIQVAAVITAWVEAIDRREVSDGTR